jgi:hypothetical protein
MKSGINRNLPIVIDIEDKITALEEKITPEGIINCNIRSMTSLVGEISNYATCYHNKSPQTDKQREKYLEWINILSICNGKSIDYAKTGVIFHVPRHIARYAKPLPYFMKYAGEYYGTLNKLNKSQSNMNRLCWEIEKWHKKLKFKRYYNDFDYHIMMDDNISHDENKFMQLDSLYIEYQKEMQELGKQNAIIKNYNDYKNYFDDDLTKEEVKNTKINWNYYYNSYKDKAKLICPNQKELANLVVKLCYEKYSKKNKKFIWIVASQGILENLKQTAIKLPIEDKNGYFEYLGNRYSLQEVIFD